MPVELIGEFGTPGASREWISAQATLAIRHIIKVCGEPPPEMELEVQWQEHELGSYPLNRTYVGRRDAWRALELLGTVRSGSRGIRERRSTSSRLDNATCALGRR